MIVNIPRLQKILDGESSADKLGLAGLYQTPLSRSLARDDVLFLSRKGALTIPDTPVRNSLIRSFVDYVYGSMPIIDLHEFLEIVEQGDGQNGQISLILLQAILFAGSAFANKEHLVVAGYQNRRAARHALFQKVRLLYDFDSEPCMTPLIQATLLMTYWYDGSHDLRDIWYWMGIAKVLADQSGLEDGLERENATEAENRLNRRLWWCIFVRDQHIALGMRRPARMKIEESNIAMLTLEDFDCKSSSSALGILPPDCTLPRDQGEQRKLADICIKQCELCICINRILSLMYKVSYVLGPRGSYSVLVPKNENGLAIWEGAHEYEVNRWMCNLPKACRYDSMSALKGCDSEVLVVHKANLKMLYLTAIAVLHHPHILPFSPWSTSTSPFFTMVQNLQRAPRDRICRTASEVSGIVRDLMELDLIHCLSTTSVTVMLPTMMVHLINIKFGSDEVMRRSSHEFSDGALLLRALTDVYPSAEAALKFIGKTAQSADIHLNALTRSLIPTWRDPESEANRDTANGLSGPQDERESGAADMLEAKPNGEYQSSASPESQDDGTTATPEANVGNLSLGLSQNYPNHNDLHGVGGKRFAAHAPVKSNQQMMQYGSVIYAGGPHYSTSDGQGSENGEYDQMNNDMMIGIEPCREGYLGMESNYMTPMLSDQFLSELSWVENQLYGEISSV
ncbi:hypothetical protein N7457_008350 [Penicillium paradoxum]|uniref:uncharacterized protein n=1 Tax=Penicillium paradoxum TaxID=176176 RepID=UPI0025475FB0|nr:uncharacterized protein N7457_008350 [Penicillium paradoxum]KAJ5773454.1 hypothetical protein N7457_008350 [Penicillium paradoxum]